MSDLLIRVSLSYYTLISAHVTSELFHLVLHVSTVFMGAQLALLTYNSVLLRKSIFAITVNAKCFVTSSS
jgi:hypothetical protein